MDSLSLLGIVIFATWTLYKLGVLGLITSVGEIASISMDSQKREVARDAIRTQQDEGLTMEEVTEAMASMALEKEAIDMMLSTRRTKSSRTKPASTT